MEKFIAFVMKTGIIAFYTLLACGFMIGALMLAARLPLE